MYIFKEFNFIFALLAVFMWSLAGWLMTARTFRLEKIERTLVAVSVGIVVNIWLANLAAQFLPQPLAFWVSTIFALLAGLALAWPLDKDLLATFPGDWKQWLAFSLITYFLTLIGRGLAIYDDVQALPTISLMAAGDVPPHFPLDPKASFGYHYFLLMFAAQFMQMAKSTPWTSIDVVRGIILALTLLLGGIWTRRLTGSRWAAFATVFFLAFAGGMRWILLLLPRSFLDILSRSIPFYGAAEIDAAGSIAALLVKTRSVDGAGVFPLPYFLLSGLDVPFIMVLTSYGVMPVLILIQLLLLADRRQKRRGYIIIAILLASLELVNEVTFVLLYAGLFFALLTWIIKNRRQSPFKTLWPEIVTFAAAGLITLFQGGMFTTMLYSRLVPGTAMTFTFVFHLDLPSFYDAHFGPLYLFNLKNLILILADAGPTFLLLPFLIAWGVRAARKGEWMSAGVALSALAPLLASPLTYYGNANETATTRITMHMLTVCKLFAVALIWNLASKRSDAIKQCLVAGGLATSIAGISLFALQVASAQTPQYSYFLKNLDASMYQTYWNKLEPGALIFDMTPYRAPTVFGRFTESATHWGSDGIMESWNSLALSPDPYKLQAAGFSYFYLDQFNWGTMDQKTQEAFESPCVKVVTNPVDGTNFRKLLDIRKCNTP